MSANKKGMELSVNFIVMLILAIVVFGLSITLTYNFMRSAQETQKQLDQQTRQQILDALDTGAKVAVIPNTISIRPGKSDIVGVGIRNILDSDSFKVDVEFDKAFDEDGTEIGRSDIQNEGDWKVYPTTKTIKKFERDTAVIAFRIPGGATAGTYIYNVMVCEGTVTNCNALGTNPTDVQLNAYDDQVHKIYVYVS